MDRIYVNDIALTNNYKAKLPRKTFKIFKAHERGIKLVRKLKVEFLVTLSISSDGFIKLWDGTEPLFSLKMPNFVRFAWNMSKIDDMKNEKSIKQVLKSLEIMKSKDWINHSPVKNLEKSKRIKGKTDNFKINL